MKIHILTLLFIVLTASSMPDQKRLPTSLLIESTFYPSFHFPTKIKIYKIEDIGYITFTVFDKRDKGKIISTDSVQLTKEDFHKFFSKLGKASISKFSYDTIKKGYDGISLAIKIQQNGQMSQFRTWSPPRDRFIDAIFYLLNNKLPRQENYIEDIQSYFNYRLPVKLKNNDPFIARFYGSISTDHDRDLQKFFKKVPRQRKAIIDMTNFQGMGTIFDEDFEEFDLSHPNLIWVIPAKNRDYFKQFGLDSTKMVETLDLATNE